ncbi:MAG: hypothetical protein ACYTF6_10015 [Planctomycetota bacterium]|jgi:hypothetical protein
MKRPLVVTLLCVNAALLVALVLTSTEQPAYGQVLGANYLVTTARAAQNWDAVYILDLSTRRMVTLGLTRENRRLRAIGPGRDLVHDFGRQRAPR